jgi:rhamnose utilization protein RhaD (predicted bifunctional aldolase and dehydrogenase)
VAKAKAAAKVSKAKPAAKKAALKKAAVPAKKVAKVPAVELGDPKETYDQFIDVVDQLQEHMEHFANGKKNSVARSRKAANEIRKLMSKFRKEIQAAKASM